MENKQLRTLARIFGMGGILVFLVYLFVKVIPALLQVDHPNTTADTALLGFLIVGYIFAWYREYEGGIMLMFITFIVGFSYIDKNSTLELGILLGICIPLFLSGLLFALYHYKKTKQLKDKS